MPLTPYKLHPLPPRLALLLDAETILLEGIGEHPFQATPPDTRVYCEAEFAADLVADGLGEALCWNLEPVRWRWRTDGAPWHDRSQPFATCIHLPFPDDPADALAGLCAWRDWLAGYRASPLSSLGSSAMSLLRATLAEPLWTAVGELPPFRFTIGGRQEDAFGDGRPHTLEGSFRHYDLPAAYAETLGRMRYGGLWTRVDRRYPFERTHLNGELVFVRARVRLPELAFGPLPRRPRHSPAGWSGVFEPVTYPRAGVVQGAWTWDELRVALTHGARILRLLDVWVHSTRPEDAPPFAPWWEAVQEGRRMRGFAGTLAKATGNSLWGQFAITPGRKDVVTYDANGERQRSLREVPVQRGRPRAFDLAEQLTGQVRARLAEFMLAAGERLVCVHTDGGWVRSSRAFRPGGGFRQKLRAERIDFLGPQFLRYYPPGEEPAYVVAGVPRKLVPETFARVWAELEQGAA